MHTHPVLIGLINAVLPGLGYLLIKERVVFGWSIFIAILLFGVVSFIDPSPVFDTILFAVNPLGKILEGFSYILALFAFGYDAYDLARRKNGTAAPITI